MIMRSLVPAMLGILISLESPAAGGGKIDFRDYYWQNRPLLLFAQTPNAAEYRGVAKELNLYSDQIADSDMIIIEVFETGLVRVDGKPMADESADNLRKRFKIRPGNLTAILIGKDGGLKLRQIDRVDLPAIFALIDTMPMRQQEMRSKGK